ncbi:hypothetical protein RI367_006316 [Sorochytrium milnesiophthora]
MSDLTNANNAFLSNPGAAFLPPPPLFAVSSENPEVRTADQAAVYGSESANQSPKADDASDDKIDAKNEQALSSDERKKLLSTHDETTATV